MGRRVQDESLFQAEAASKTQLALPNDTAQIRDHAGISFVIEGDDARFVNGRFAQKKVSELVKLAEGRDWLGSLWRLSSKELQQVIRKQFDA
jgi:hypothetical protein